MSSSLIQNRLETDCYQIVPVRSEAFALFSNEDLMRGYACSIPWTEEQFNKKMENWPTGYSIIKDEHVIGHLELAPGNIGTEVAIMVAQAWQKQGIGLKVLCAIKERVDNPYVLVHEHNCPMRRLAAKVGMKILADI